jgi:hypothetical protein
MSKCCDAPTRDCGGAVGTSTCLCQANQGPLPLTKWYCCAHSSGTVWAWPGVGSSAEDSMSFGARVAFPGPLFSWNANSAVSSIARSFPFGIVWFGATRDDGGAVHMPSTR